MRVPQLLALGLSAAGVLNAQAWQSDNGDGTFTNPPLYADYPDPDIVRVGKDFYFATTTFVNSPGLTVLRSQDLVNWEIASHVDSRLKGYAKYDLTNGTAYRQGVWAPSLRYYSGTFYAVVNPNPSQGARVYYSRDVRGPWHYHELDREALDPGLFIDAGGTGYIVTSASTDGHVKLLRLNEDFSRVVEARHLFYCRGAEGSKMVKRGNWY